jgi:hypothetical protein
MPETDGKILPDATQITSDGTVSQRDALVGDGLGGMMNEVSVPSGHG